MRGERDARPKSLLEGCFGFQDRVDMAGSSLQLCKASPGFGRVRSGLIGSDRVTIEQARTSLDKHRSFDVERSSGAHRSCEAAMQKLYLVVSLDLCW